MSGVIVHNLEQSRSFRVIWLLEELGQKHEVKQYKRDPKADNGPAQLAKVHPLGKQLRLPPVHTLGPSLMPAALVNHGKHAGTCAEQAAAHFAKDWPAILLLDLVRMNSQPHAHIQGSRR